MQSSRTLIVLATLGSAGLLGGAFAFQYIGGLAPCQLCLWQRWPHAAAILIGVVALLTGWRGLAWLGALAALATAGIGIFHVGVEQLWWEGLASCTAGSIEGHLGC
jgi:disulfide bond formation protein DsbB